MYLTNLYNAQHILSVVTDEQTSSFVQGALLKTKLISKAATQRV